MSIRDRLLQKLKDPSLADSLGECESLEALAEAAKERGIELDAEELEGITDLSDDDLEGIAGGAGGWSISDSPFQYAAG